MGKLTPNADLWDEIHSRAHRSRSRREKEEFILFIHYVRREMSCPNCRHHMKKFMKKKRIEKYFHFHDENGQPNGMFVWTWKLHNNVNARLGKRIVSYQEAIERYSNYCCE